MTLRPDKHDPQSLAFATQAVHVGNEIDAGSGAIRTPLVMANSYALPEDPTGIDWSDTNSLFYTRNTGLNQLRLEEKLAALERGEAAAVFATGVAALHGVFFTLLESGDHVVLSDVTYEAIWRLFDELLPDKYGISATFVDITNPDEVRAAMRPETKLIHTEVIANPTTEVADIAALAEIAHESGALLTVDSTFSPPPMFRPLEHGADLVAHSLTKYINGHGDAMGGAVIGSNALISKIKADALVDVGGAISPFNAWMITRGSVTLPLRLRQHVESAQRVAEFLAKDPFVAYVYYPGLASHPQHESARRQFGDAGAGRRSTTRTERREHGPPRLRRQRSRPRQRRGGGIRTVPPATCGLVGLEPIRRSPTYQQPWTRRSGAVLVLRCDLIVTSWLWTNDARGFLAMEVLAVRWTDRWPSIPPLGYVYQEVCDDALPGHVKSDFRLLRVTQQR
ncbi:MAG: aminotransferase class I/II-fold pyridoxal phosphate-dependent enzyme [Thermomicrobiales bacterium]